MAIMPSNRTSLSIEKFLEAPFAGKHPKLISKGTKAAAAEAAVTAAEAIAVADFEEAKRLAVEFEAMGGDALTMAIAQEAEPEDHSRKCWLAHERLRVSEARSINRAESLTARMGAAVEVAEVAVAEAAAAEAAAAEAAAAEATAAVEAAAAAKAAADAVAAGDLITARNLAARSHALGEAALGNLVEETAWLPRRAAALLNNSNSSSSIWGLGRAGDSGALFGGSSAFGAGFGGSVWALVDVGAARVFEAAWQRDYRLAFPEHAETAAFFVMHPGPGACRL
jgi:galactokinase